MDKITLFTSIILILLFSCSQEKKKKPINVEAEIKQEESSQKISSEVNQSTAQTKEGDKQVSAEENYQKALEFQKEKKEKDAFNSFLKAAEGKHSKSMVELSKCFYKGKGVKKNSRKGFSWEVKAAEHGDKKSMLSIAMVYKLQKNEKDPAKCVYWLRKATDLNHPQAISNLAYCYIQGFGVDIDYQKALKLSEKAIELGYDMKSTVEGLKKYFILKKKADSGDLKAKHDIAYAFMYGQGVWRDEKVAINLLTKVANKGFTQSQRALGMYYFRNAQPDLAYSWLKKEVSDGSRNSIFESLENERNNFTNHMVKAKNGDSKSQYRIAAYYYSGKYINKDIEKAKKWAESAAHLGDSQAVNLLKAIKKTATKRK